MRRQRKTFSRPTKRWDKSRIDSEIRLLRDYGLKNKRELWKAKDLITKFRSRARKLFGDDAGKEELFAKLHKMGIFKKEATLDDVLGLTVESILERRLQTLVLRKGMASTPAQARQLIAHRHVMLGGRVVDVPGYLVTVSEEKTIEFSPNSPVSDTDHPIHGPPKPVVKEAETSPGKASPGEEAGKGTGGGEEAPGPEKSKTPADAKKPETAEEKPAPKDKAEEPEKEAGPVKEEAAPKEPKKEEAGKKEEPKKEEVSE
jgi:small subunit ribosomal protein S4